MLKDEKEVVAIKPAGFIKLLGNLIFNILELILNYDKSLIFIYV